MAKATKKASRPRRTPRKASSVMVFTRRNYTLLILGVVAIVVGYAIMRLENEVDGIISLYIAPLLILAGYLEIIYAILWRPKPDAEDTAS